MNTDQKNTSENKDTERFSEKASSPSAEQAARNPNPRANENIRIRTEEPESTGNESGIGSEITDGEDA